MKEILNIIHKTIYQFFDVCEDDKEVPMSDKDKLLLEVNKAICNNLKALEQQPCGDCISRQAMLETQAKYAEYIGATKFWQMRDDIKALPPVTPQPERKIGKWHLLDECSNEGWYCDQCHKKVFKADFSNTMKKYKFCPNCGAKMEV